MYSQSEEKRISGTSLCTTPIDIQDRMYFPGMSGVLDVNLEENDWLFLITVENKVFS